MAEPTKRIFGIDLGTTFSAISYVNDDGKPEIICNSDGERTMPSVVFFESASNIVAGTVAKESGKTDPENVIEFVKRNMGTDWTFDFEGTSYTPQMISSVILKRLAQDAEQALNCEVKDVVITCPAYFGDEHRKATEQAGTMAGLNVIQILDEPAAAALCYAFDHTQESRDKTILVYDLGGGTFDATVLSIKDGNIEVVCTDGDHRLGGADWDNRIMQFFATKFQEETGSSDDILDDIETKYDLRLSAETAKKALSKKESTLVSVAYEGEKVKVTLTRDEFNSMTSDLLEQTYVLTDKVLQIAKDKGFEHIDEILLVGSSTLMCQVPEGITARYGDPLGIPVLSYQPDAAVAKGASIYAFLRYVQNSINDVVNNLKEQGASEQEIKQAEEEVKKNVAATLGLAPSKVQDIVDTKVTLCATKSYGIEICVDRQTQQMELSTMIVRQSPLPAKSDATFGLIQDDQRDVSIKVYSHDLIPELVDPNAPDEPLNRKTLELKYCSFIGENTLTIPPGKRAGDPIQVTFELNNETGMLDVTACEPDSGNEIHCQFEVINAMSEQEVEEAKQMLSHLTIG